MATSVKTLDTRTASRIKDPRVIYNQMKGYIDDVVNFKEGKASVSLKPDMISGREMVIAIPEMTKINQWEQVNKAVAYGYNQGINVKVAVIKND